LLLLSFSPSLAKHRLGWLCQSGAVAFVFVLVYVICLGRGAYAQETVLAPERAVPVVTSASAPTLQPSPRLPLVRSQQPDRNLPIFLSAGELSGRPDLEVSGQGNVEFYQGALFVRADRLHYDITQALVQATGQVRLEREGTIFTGPELLFRVNQFEGFFLNPTYRFAATQAGGQAERLDFINDQRLVVTRGTYSSCPPDGSQDPPWLLSADRVRLNMDQNEGIAEGGVLRFFGVPILGAPVLSFPVSDERKSGWLPPNYTFDTRSGVQLGVPYYWNIAPQRDATFTPSIVSRRGFGLESEFRYLEPEYSGELRLNLLPGDRLTRSDRYGLNFNHVSDAIESTQYGLKLLRVSDDDYWKDFPRNIGSSTPRLLLSEAQVSKPFGDWTAYARAMKWQVLQGTDPLAKFEAPYERAPQVGLRTLQSVTGGLQLTVEAEVNRFVNPLGTLVPTRVTGTRVHSVASLSRSWQNPGWTLTPRLSVNTASYDLDQTMTSGPWAGKRNATRAIPTISLDSQWVFERDTRLLGRSLRQTLEPRVVYARTPYRDQSGLPVFDAALKDFNLNAVYAENLYSGVDRVSDANQATVGVTTRWLDPSTGGEVLRLGLAQRYLFATQRITAEGTPSTRRLSDIYFEGATGLIPQIMLASSVQYNPEISRAVNYSNTAVYMPAPFKVLSLRYTGVRNATEQISVGGQWPLYGPASGNPASDPLIRRMSTGGSCTGTVYAVGNVNYNRRDSRVTDSLFGLEYDAGCWIGRFVVERLSTGLSEANTRIYLQLELVGLSRLGTNPLQRLKDNVVGYQLLRDRANPQTTPGPYD
jgi:LPS-assembly protein